MLLISEVDLSEVNVERPDGFILEEALLHDLNLDGGRLNVILREATRLEEEVLTKIGCRIRVNHGITHH